MRTARRMGDHQFFGHRLSVYTFCWPHEIRPFGQGLHASAQMTFYVIEADAAEAQDGFFFAAGFGDDDDWLGAVEDCSGPGCVLATEADVDAAGEVSLGIFCCVADVEDLGACVAKTDDFVEFDGFEDLSEVFV